MEIPSFHDVENKCYFPYFFALLQLARASVSFWFVFLSFGICSRSCSLHHLFFLLLFVVCCLEKLLHVSEYEHKYKLYYVEMHALKQNCLKEIKHLCNESTHLTCWSSKFVFSIRKHKQQVQDSYIVSSCVFPFLLCWKWLQEIYSNRISITAY